MLRKSPNHALRAPAAKAAGTALELLRSVPESTKPMLVSKNLCHRLKKLRTIKPIIRTIKPIPRTIKPDIGLEIPDVCHREVYFLAVSRF
jgi:hypothetical protein